MCPDLLLSILTVTGIAGILIVGILTLLAVLGII